MTGLRFAILLLFWPLVAGADSYAPPLPALYDVTDVAADDHLNIRLLPKADAPVIDTLDPGTTDLQVVGLSLQGNWAYISRGEMSGWVAFRFLQRQRTVKTSLGLPPTLRCFGTEPFWTITFNVDDITLSRPEGDATFPILSTSPSLENAAVNVTGFLLNWMHDERRVRAHILPGLCSDGMSDTIYGLHYVDTFMPNSGCCSL